MADKDNAVLASSHLSAGGSVVKEAASFHEFEFALHHIVEAFARWSSALHEFVSGELLPQADVSVLQLIRMNEEPKSAADIGRFLNRDDNSNILYALRKLEKAGLIRKCQGPLRQTTYTVTARGMEVTDRYAQVRGEVLLRNLGTAFSEEELESTIRNLWNICGLYEQGARTISVRRVLQGDAAGEGQRVPEALAKAATPAARGKVAAPAAAGKVAVGKAVVAAKPRGRRKVAG